MATGGADGALGAGSHRGLLTPGRALGPKPAGCPGVQAGDSQEPPEPWQLARHAHSDTNQRALSQDTRRHFSSKKTLSFVSTCVGVKRKFFCCVSGGTERRPHVVGSSSGFRPEGVASAGPPGPLSVT